MNIPKLFLELLFIILFIFIIYVLYKPTLVFNYLNKHSIILKYPTPTDSIVEDGLYYRIIRNDPPAKNLLIWIVGGGFISAYIESGSGTASEFYKLAKKRNNPFDILIVGYPVLYKASIYDSLCSVSKTIKDFINKYPNYDYIHLVGFSAGVLLGGLFIEIETDDTFSRSIKIKQTGTKINSATFICGAYSLDYLSYDILRIIFNFYFLRGSPNKDILKITTIKIPHHVITTKNEFLHNQSKGYILANRGNSMLTFEDIDSDWLKHEFIQIPYLEQTQKVLSDMLDRINTDQAKTL